jgi:hypothetical protein
LAKNKRWILGSDGIEKIQKVAIEVVLIGLGLNIPRCILPRVLTQSHSTAKTRAEIKQNSIYIEEIGAHPQPGVLP